MLITKSCPNRFERKRTSLSLPHSLATRHFTSHSSNLFYEYCTYLIYSATITSSLKPRQLTFNLIFVPQVYEVVVADFRLVNFRLARRFDFELKLVQEIKIHGVNLVITV